MIGVFLDVTTDCENASIDEVVSVIELAQSQSHLDNVFVTRSATVERILVICYIEAAYINRIVGSIRFLNGVVANGKISERVLALGICQSGSKNNSVGILQGDCDLT